VTRTETRTQLIAGEKTARRRAFCALGTMAGAVGLVAGIGGCADEGSPPAAEPLTLVSVETQRCRQPNRFHGVGIVVGDDLVLTAGHVVEGELRDLTVDGEPARVVTIDRRTDLAIVSAHVPDATPLTPAPAVPESALMIAASSRRDVAIDRHVTLVVEHATDRATYRRDVVIFVPGVVDGDSGSPLVDDAGRLVGIVVAEQQGEGVAVTVDEVDAVLATASASDDLTWPNPPGTC
jgi:S1-C subfamily serine protease